MRKYTTFISSPIKPLTNCQIKQLTIMLNKLLVSFDKLTLPDDCLQVGMAVRGAHYALTVALRELGYYQTNKKIRSEEVRRAQHGLHLPR